MAEPKINKHWWNDEHFPLRPFLAVGLPVFLLAVALILSTFKGCNGLGQSGKQDVFQQPEDEGFVGKTNELLEELLKDTVSGVNAIDLESLNKRYPSLVFALPYGEDHKPVIEASDLRLVDIRAERMKSKWRDFYYNSRLPQLLRQQKEQIGDAFFEIKASGTKYDPESQTKPIVLKSIKLHASMFKVALAKNPWKGTIYARENCLFNDSNAVFLTYGTSMIPIPKCEEHAMGAAQIKVKAFMDNCRLEMADGNSVDYYDIYKKAFDSSNAERMKSLQVAMYEKEDTTESCIIQISCTKSSLAVVSSSRKIRIFSGKQDPVSMDGAINSQVKSKPVPLCDGMKIAAYDNNERKLGEFTIHLKDPSLKLSSLIQTNLGTTRYNIPQDQTDLFTQQLVRGLSRHLSVEDSINEVKLSIDPMLSLEFEKQVREYVHTLETKINAPANQVNEQYDMSLTIMDLATGEVLASPFYTTKFDAKDYPEDLKLTTRNVSLSRRYIGSTFKPFIAFAATQANPNLLELNTVGKYSLGEEIGPKKRNVNFFGHKTRGWALNTNHWGGTNFIDFIANSDDVYPVALAAIAMTGENVSNTMPLTGENNFFEEKDFLRFRSKGLPNYTTHPFTNWLGYVTSVNPDSYDGAGLMDPFKLLKGMEHSKDSISQSFGLSEVSPDIVNMHFDLFSGGDDFRGTLVPWVLGQGNNEWNCITMAQAWARMIGRRNVIASYLDTKSYMKGEFASLSTNVGVNFPGCNTNGGQAQTKAEIDATWNSFLDKLSTAPSHGGTLGDMKKAVDNLNTIKGQDPFVLYCKTGTPDSYSRYEVSLLGGNNRYFDTGMFSFVLAPQSSVAQIKSGNTGHGIVCIVRATRTYQCAQCSQKKKQCPACDSYNGLWSTDIRDFFSKSPERMRMLYDMTRNYY